MSDTFIEKIFDVFYRKYEPSYSHLTELKDIELISFTYGIFLILQSLEIDPEKIKVGNSDLQVEIDLLIKNSLKEDLKISDQEKLYDFIHDKDNVNI